jgi:hypothetical protein
MIDMYVSVQMYEHIYSTPTTHAPAVTYTQKTVTCMRDRNSERLLEPYDW